MFAINYKSKKELYNLILHFWDDDQSLIQYACAPYEGVISEVILAIRRRVINLKITSKQKRYLKVIQPP